MQIALLGLNTKSSDLATREQVAKAAALFFEEDGDSVLLSTCNRTEIYFSGANLAERHSQILQQLRERVPVPFEHLLYSFFAVDCFAHLAKVTAGLDSVIIGETEIQRQVKHAYRNAATYRTLSSPLHFLFQKSLKIAKEARNCLGTRPGMPTLEGTLFDLARSVFKSPSLFFVGNSEINRKILSYFASKGISDLSLCTRSPQSATPLQKKYSVKIAHWQKMGDWQRSDLTICGTTHNHYLIQERPSQLSSCKLLIDLSMPRTIAPHMAEHPQISLLNMEEVGQLVKKQQSWHLEEIEKAEAQVLKAAHLQRSLFEEKEKQCVHI